LVALVINIRALLCVGDAMGSATEPESELSL